MSSPPAVTEPLRGARLLGSIAIIAVLYVIIGRLGLTLATYQSNATLVWPPSGLAIAALALYGRRIWPGVLAGALIANLLIDTPPLAAVGIAVGNTLEAVLGAWLLSRVARFDPSFSRLRDVLSFFLFGALTCTVVSATLGTASLAASGLLEGRDPGTVWLIWWLGDAGGATLFAPLVFVWARGKPSWVSLAARPEAWIVLALVFASSATAFGPWALPRWIASLLSWAPLAFLIWAGLRLGPRGAVTASALACSVAVIGTANGEGPFSSGSPEEQMLGLWAYSTAFGAATAILAALVAERRLAEEKRREVEVQMERAQRLEALGVLASGVAHDFNNLLLAIRGNAEALKMDLESSPDAAQQLADIEHASDRAADLCRQLLDYAGGSVGRLEPLRVSEITSDVVRLLRGSIPRKIAIETAQDRVPAVLADPSQLRQVLMNLLMNAAEAIGEREGTIAIRVRTRDVDRDYLESTFLASDAPAGRFVAIEVEDDGSGMDPKTLAHVFEPFFTTKQHGRGLGLAALTGIVRAHNGAVKVTSAPGRGTTFTVLLPVAADVIVHEAPQPGVALVADDEAAVLAVVRGALERAGWTVCSATDGREAVVAFAERKNEIDLVVLDIDMPALDGWEALDAMRAVRADVPVLLISGLSPGRDLPELTVFLPKPFDTKALLAAVSRAAGRAAE